MSFRVIHFSVKDIGAQFHVGFIKAKDEPALYGNHFGFLNPDRDKNNISPIDIICGPHCVNMWVDNLHAVCFKRDIDKFRTLVFGEYPYWLAFIDDERLNDWTNKYLSIKGFSSPYLEEVSKYSGLKVIT